MAYGLKYYFEDKKIVGSTTTTYRFEILEDGYSGSSTQWTGVQIQRQYEELSFRQLNNIQKSTCTGIVRVEDATQRGVIESIAASEIGDYKVQLKKNGSVIWNGLLTPDLTSITEENYNNQTATLVAKDMLFSGDYALSSGSEKAIVIIASLLNTLGYGLNIKTYTTWTESEISASDDVLNQVYHEKERLRIYAKAAGEEPRPLTNEQALIYMLKSYGLILRQANNAWQLIQLSALDDVTAAPISTYNSSGGQLTSLGTVDLREAVDSNDLYILGSSSNNYFAGLKKVKGKFDHQSVVQGIQIPRELWLTDTNQSYTQFWQGDGTGNLSLEFNLWVADTGSIADTFPSAQIRIQSGSYYWNGIAWGTTATQITLEVTGPVTTDSDGNHIYKSGLVSIVTDPIPDAADGTLTVTFIPSPTIVTSVVYSYFRDMIFNLSYQDDIENSLSIDYEYEQDGTYNAEYDFGSFYFGDGPASASLSALKDADDNNTNAWKQIGEGTTISHVELLLREILDFQRGQRRNIRSALYGEFEPEKVVSYDSKNFFFLGGSWDSQNYQWSANLIEANPTTGTNTLTTYYNTTGAGTTTSASTGSTGSGTGTSTLYLEKANNLSDLNSVSAARDNLELGTSDSPTFAGLTVNGNISVTGNVDGRDVSADGADLDELYTTIGLSALTSAEVDQLENIDSVTISNTQWGYLGALDQPLTTISDVQFDDITSTGIIYTDNIDTVSIVWNISTQEWDATPSEYFNNPVFIGTSLDVDNDLEVDGYANIGTDLDVGGNTALLGTLSVSGNTTLGGTLTLSGSADFNSTMNLQGNLTTQADLQDDGFSEGWAGTNWKINADGSAEFEEMRIRGALRVYEFIAKQISTIGGSEILSIAQGRVVSAGSGEIEIENVTGTPGNSFKSGDLWICQVVDINNDLESGGTGSIVKSVRGLVDSVAGNTLTVTVESGSLNDLEQGDLIVGYGSTSDADRQAIMYRNVDRSEDNLIMRLQTDITEFADLQDEANTRVAFGDLNGYSGLSSETFGFFAGSNSGGHILATSSGLFLKDGATVLAQLTSNTFKVGGDTKYIEFDGTDLDVQAQDFKLEAGELVIDSSLDKKIVVSNATEEIIAIGDFDFGTEVEDTSTASATSSSTTATVTSATPTNSDTNMDTAVGTLNANVAQDSPIVTLSRTYNVTGKWVRVQFNYEAPRYDNESLGERAVGFSITYFGNQIQELGRDEFDSNTVSGSVDDTIFVPDTATFNTIQVQSLASSGGLSQFEVHGKVNVTSLSVTVYDDTYSYTDIGNDGFRVYNSGGRKKIEFKDGNATATLDTLSIGSWDFELASNGDLVLKYDGTTVQTFTKP